MNATMDVSIGRLKILSLSLTRLNIIHIAVLESASGT